MPKIKSSAELRNSDNGIEAYAQLMGRFELYGKLQDGLNDIQQGKTRPLADMRSRTHALRTI